MKIALLFPNNKYTAPYLKYYTDILKKQEVEFDLYTWNRFNTEEEECIAFNSNSSKRNPISLIVDYINFKKFIIKNLKNNNYDSIIVFSCQLGIFLQPFLKKKFKDKYILDIRDYSKTIDYFKIRFKKLISNASKVFISSEGFKEWLPKEKEYVMSHNIDSQILSNNDIATSKKEYFTRKSLNIDTIGAIRDFESNMNIINTLKNNENFYLNFYGEGNATSLLRRNSENINNVYFHGYYKKKDELPLLKDTDFINIILNDNIQSKFLTSNRLYLSALLKIPCIIIEKNIEQFKIVQKYNLGVIVTSSNEIPLKIKEFIASFNQTEYIKNCILFLDKVKKDQEIFNQNILNFINK
ncbi:glycosyltransferase family protein [Cellulophaga baltica]|uniref:Capsular biosynthesis protein n=1 Tax=Cellulophaga baltica 18 TaxID=1348584 RepID=A0AAU8RG34_9FLAO|nr:hypothetical protein [Cellulophaga baltica]AIZ42296.1 hypothetical protein M666_12290 [Cellulophaga baltica 18]